MFDYKNSYNMVINELVLIIKQPFKYLRYQYYAKRNRNIDYFYIKKLLNEVKPYGCHSGHIGNKAYGNYYTLKKYFGKTFRKKCMIEHGVYFAEYVIDSECKMNDIDTIYTFSNYRKNAILKYYNYQFDKEIIPIGPYIKYAKNFHSKAELEIMKRKYGKILLVFPSHSLCNKDRKYIPLYDFANFTECIDNIAKDYDTIMVSMIGDDIKQGLAKQYTDKGYIVVSSGSRFDPYFLSRLRDLIELADMSISNDVGTHIGYCICLGTPHFLYSQDIVLLDTELSPEMRVNIEKRKEEYNEIKMAFSVMKPIISKEQLSVVRKYWGDWC